jgi:hypothetical protein
MRCKAKALMRLTVALACSALATIAMIGWLSPEHAWGGAPGVTLTKTPDDATIQAGDTASFTISGVAGGTNGIIFLEDQLPGDGLTWSVDAFSGVGCPAIPATNLLFCVGAVSGSDVSYSVTVSAVTDESDCGTLENTAEVEFSSLFTASDTGSITIECPPEIPGPPDIEPIDAPPPLDVDVPQPEQPFVVQAETTDEPEDDGVGPQVGTGDSQTENASSVTPLQLALLVSGFALTGSMLWRVSKAILKRT